MNKKIRCEFLGGNRSENHRLGRLGFGGESSINERRESIVGVGDELNGVEPFEHSNFLFIAGG